MSTGIVPVDYLLGPKITNILLDYFYVGSKDQTQVFRLSRKHLYSPNQLTGLCNSLYILDINFLSDILF